MEHVVLARKYRPRSFRDVVGQEHVLRALQNSLKQNRLHQAYLLTGTRGIGKTTIARILAKSLNCSLGVTDEPCCCCSACHAIDEGSFIDVWELDAATHTKVDDMRQLLEKVMYPPVSGRFKVYVIDEVHMLSNSAFNAMLKMLEEPPSHAKFILATTDPQKIPLPVLSRCLSFSLRCLSLNQIVHCLEEILAKEGIAYDHEGLRIVAQAASGSMRDALSILDQGIAHGAGVLSAESVRAMLGVADFSHIVSLFELISESKIQDALVLGREMLAQGSFLNDICLKFMSLFHQMALLQTVSNTDLVDLGYRSRIEALVVHYTPEDIQLFYQIVSLSRQGMDVCLDSAVLLDMLLIRLYAFSPQLCVPTIQPQLCVPTIQQQGVSHSNALSLVEKETEKEEQPIDADPCVPSSSLKEGVLSCPQSQEDWIAFCSKGEFDGMIRQFVENCTWVSSSTECHWVLAVNALSKKLFPIVQKRLEDLLVRIMGKKIAVVVCDLDGQSGTIVDESLAFQRRDRKKRDYQESLTFLENDRNVRKLVEKFGGVVDVVSEDSDCGVDK